MISKRTYRDSCGIARALDHVGERWALLVVRELVLGPKRFTDLRHGILAVGPDVLAQRLRDLEAAGILRRRWMPPPAAARVYELTEWGAELEPVLVALGRWGSRAPLPEGRPPLSPDALAIALETTFDATANRPARGPRAYQINLGEHEFVVMIGAAGIEVRRGRAEQPAVTLEAAPATMAALLWHGLPLAEARREGTVGIEGSVSEVTRFLEYFRAPEPVLP